MAFDPDASIAAEAQQAAAAVPAPVKKTIFDRFVRLFTPDPRTPEEFRGCWIARKINDRLGAASEEALLGESVTLCVDVLKGGQGGSLPPIAHLGWSGFKYVDLRRSSQNRQAAENVAERKEPTKR